MRRENFELLSEVSMGASFNSNPIKLEHIALAAIQKVALICAGPR